LNQAPDSIILEGSSYRPKQPTKVDVQFETKEVFDGLSCNLQSLKTLKSHHIQSLLGIYFGRVN